MTLKDFSNMERLIFWPSRGVFLHEEADIMALEGRLFHKERLIFWPSRGVFLHGEADILAFKGCFFYIG